MEVEFTLRPLTIKEAIMAQEIIDRVSRGQVIPVATFAKLVASRSDVAVGDVMALPVTEIPDLMRQLAESLNRASALMVLEQSMGNPNLKGENECPTGKSLSKEPKSSTRRRKSKRSTD